MSTLNQLFTNVDMLYETMTNLNYFEIIRLCQTNRATYTSCRNNSQIIALISQKKQDQINEYVTQFGSTNNALTQAIKSGNDILVNNLIDLGVDPSLNQKEHFKNAFWRGYINIIRRLVNDPRIYTPCLDLSNIHFSEIDIFILNLIFEHNNTITCLNLSNNELYSPIIVTLFESLANNTTLASLASLDLSTSRIDDTSATVLFNNLKQNKTLTSLNLYNNNIGTKRNNRDEPASYAALIEMLKSNKTLTDLNLDLNLIGQERRRIIENYIKRNQQLRNVMHACVRGGLIEAINDEYLPQGVSLLSRTGKGNTPLHWAVGSKNPKMYDYILEQMKMRNLPTDLKNDEGKTAADLRN